tara:strand:+ start:119 stop:862 length:744 start_codon:yes stop_codon:yes gene_type:complete
MMALDEYPRPDFIVFADTHHETQGTYDFAERWAPWLGEHGLQVVTVEGTRTQVILEGRSRQAVMIPAFTLGARGNRGQIRRQCTYAWKIAPIRHFIRNELKARGEKKRAGAAECWQGISLDEWRRMRTSDVQYISNEYPLVDLRMTRQDCLEWLKSHDLPAPPKSACTFCPFHNLAAWKALKRLRGVDWQEAVKVDEAIRHKRSHAGYELYVHPGLKPLAKAIALPEDGGGFQSEMDIECEGGYCFT